MFVTDTVNRKVKRLALATGEVVTIAGNTEGFDDRDGIGAEASFRNLSGLASSVDGTALFVSVYAKHVVQKKRNQPSPRRGHHAGRFKEWPAG